ncbi:multi-copper oxidase [Mycena metata]|uniref:Multi-copper oxidase n=1 Tax=Mycena metata TaxID=1033252 RepID=A0AAD7K5X0_9AGAR|nr:multi-copper oxidase [Mycena metata]
MPDAVDEEPLLPNASSGGHSVSEKPTRRKRLLACLILILLAIPFVFLFWIPSWPKIAIPAPGGAAPDAFILDPVFDRAAEPQTRIYRWNVSSVSVPGVNGNRIVVNGRSPGPMIEANVLKSSQVYVTNGLNDENGTSIHWHGLPQPNTPFYDGPAGTSQCPIPPGATLLYNFTLGGWTGTTWWHGHTDMQHTDGLYGAIVIHGPANDITPTYHADHALVMSDIYRAPVDELLEPYLMGTPVESSPEPVPDWAEINGRGGGAHDDELAQQEEGKYFEVNVQSGTTTRLRLINAGTFAPFRVSIDGHSLTVIEADGAPVEPVRVRDLVLQSAQRYSVLVNRSADSNTTTAFWIRARMIDEPFGYTNPGIQLEARAILRYTDAPHDRDTPPNHGSSVTIGLPLPTSTPGPPPGDTEWYQLPQFDEWELRPPASEQYAPPAGPAFNLPFKFSVQRTHDRFWRSFINGTSWEGVPLAQAALVSDTARLSEGRVGVQVWPGDQLIAGLEHGQTVDFIITNLDDGDHPFHLHGYSPWLLGVGHGRYKPATAKLNTVNPLWRDTFTVPRRSWAVVRIHTDNAGYWAFHCHIGWHMIAGGLFQIAVPTSDGGVPEIPEDIKEQCKAWL